MADGTPTSVVTDQTITDFKTLIDQATEAYNFNLNKSTDDRLQSANVSQLLHIASLVLTGFVLGLRGELIKGLEMQSAGAKYQDLIGGIAIFNKYDHIDNISADHDIIYAGPDPATVSTEDTQALGTFGWYADESFACFYHYT